MNFYAVLARDIGLPLVAERVDVLLDEVGLGVRLDQPGRLL